MRALGWIGLSAALATAALGSLHPPPARAQGAALAEGEAANGTAAARVEVTGAARRDGVLTVTVRFTSLPDAKGDITFYRNAAEGYEAVYLVAGDRKYFALKDSEGKPLMPERAYLETRGGGQRQIWAGKFTAPPAGLKEFSLVLPYSSPLDAIPITDR